MMRPTINEESDCLRKKNLRRRHGPPSSLQGQFSNLSKSGQKNRGEGGGGGYVCDISPVI